MKKQNLAKSFLTVVFTLFSLAWIYPIVMILLNSLKKEYLFLFNVLTDAEEALQQLCRELMAAQQQAEELFLEEPETVPPTVKST